MLYENAPLGYVSLDEYGNYIEVNPAWLKIIGYTYKEVVGKSFCDFLNPAWVNQFKDNFRRYKESGEQSDVEYEMIKKDGSPVLVSVDGKIGKDKHGQFLRTHCILQDITKRRQVEIALRQSEERYRHLYNNTPAMMHSIDRNDRIIGVSDYWLVKLGYERREVIGRKSVEFLSKESRGIAEDVTLPLFFREGFIRDVPYQFIKKNGEAIDILLSAISEKDTEGEITRSLAVLTDITERKKIQNELIDSRQKLRNLAAHLQKLREEDRMSIAREIHDDVGQTLSALKLDLGWIEKRIPNDKVKIAKKISEMKILITECVQSVKRLCSELRPGILDDLGLIAALNWYTGQFMERADVLCHLEIELGEMVIDKDLSISIYRIVQESLTNVSRHASAQNVWVSLVKESGNLVLTIRDDGKGVDVNQIEGKRSYGIIGMNERVISHDGQFEIRQHPERGYDYQGNISSKA